MDHATNTVVENNTVQARQLPALAPLEPTPFTSSRLQGRLHRAISVGGARAASLWRVGKDADATANG